MRTLAFALYFIAFNGLAQVQTVHDSVNKTDASGIRQGKWIITNKLMRPPLPNYGDDEKVEEGRYQDGKKIGVWVAWYPGGVMKNRITFENGRPFGKAIMYHENGKVAEEGLWRNNRWVGDYKLYYENGEVQHEFKFNPSGKREGKQVYYAENGQKIIEGEMKDGKESGIWNEWYDNGDKRSEKAFNDGNLDPVNTHEYEAKKPDVPKKDLPQKEEPVLKEDTPNSYGKKTVDVAPDEKPNTPITEKKPFTGEGQAKLYRLDKQISKDGEFHKYKLINGKAYIYNSDGILERIAVYQDGKYIGDAPLPVE
jgi:antitoxin component YwqK of YwqJK toxin-antitoxin module